MKRIVLMVKAWIAPGEINTPVLTAAFIRAFEKNKKC